LRQRQKAANEASMNRILVIGNAGAGKSTFARRLGGKLGLPVIHLDSHFWRPGWQIPETSAWRQQLIALAVSPLWVMDGNYINTFDIRMPCADSLVWLDHPRGTCMRRVLMRTIIGHGRTRSDLAEGCPDRFDIAFLRYVWNFQVKQRPRIIGGIEQFGSHLRVIRLACDREVENFLTLVAAR
jgi:adenylate kinase family enzyme